MDIGYVIAFAIFVGLLLIYRIELRAKNREKEEMCKKGRRESI